MNTSTRVFITLIFIITLNTSAKTEQSQEPDATCETFSFRLHRDNYVLIEKYSDEPNIQPFFPYLGLVPGVDLTKNEVAFQISFKVKAVDNLAGLPLDLWGGYTQQSFWQAYNGEASRPFRETNYQPEIMTVLQIDHSLLGVTLRSITGGLEHQSNGQLALFSRSWNRIYGELGFQSGPLTLTGRLWTQFGEMVDNLDIYKYMGHGHVAASFHWRGHVLSGLLRYNLSSDYGAAQVSWAFPILTHFKGYVQFFSGYGQSLIDYNAYQKTIGLGFLISY